LRGAGLATAALAAAFWAAMASAAFCAACLHGSGLRGGIGNRHLGSGVCAAALLRGAGVGGNRHALRCVLRATACCCAAWAATLAAFTVLVAC
jgi:hypothetical protein